MANKSAILAVKIVSDAKDFKKGTDEALTGVQKLSNGLKGLAVPALAVGAGLVKLGSDFVKMASDFEQNSGAVNAVFKGNAKEIDKFASESAKKLGLSGSDYKQYAALLGSQLKNAGTPLDQLAGKTDKLINVGADFAAQFGGTVPDAISAMSSALKGEFDPMEKYGISLSASKVEAEAMAMGAKKVNGELTDQAKQAAILSLINKQGADAMGANSREAGTAAGVQARLSAAYEDMGVKLGTMLLPALTVLGEILTNVVNWMSQNSEMVGILAAALGILVAGILVLNGAMMIMNMIALVNPWVILAVAVVALVGFIIYLATQTQFFQTVWAAVAKFCGDAWNTFVKWITDVWNGFMGWIRGALNNIGNFFSGIFNGIRNVVSGVMNAVRNFFSSAFNSARNIVSSVLNSIGSFFRSVFNGAMSVIRSVYSTVASVFNSISSAIRSVLNWIGQAFSTVFNGARNTVTSVINTIVGAFNNVSNAVQTAINWVSNLFNGFSVPGWMRDVMNFMGGGMTGVGEVSLGYDLSGLPAGMGATGSLGFAAALGGASGGRTEVNNYHITVNGAIDPQSTARQIKKLLTNDATRNGKIDAGSALW